MGAGAETAGAQIGVLIAGNEAPNAWWIRGTGGGVALRYTSTARLRNVVITGNEAYEAGAGVHVDRTSGPELVNVVIEGNVAGTGGGGVYVDSGALTLSYCNVWSNGATADRWNGLPDSVPRRKCGPGSGRETRAGTSKLREPGEKLQPIEVFEVIMVGGDEHESLRLGDGRDLPIGKRGREARRHEPRPFAPVPLGCGGVVG